MDQERIKALIELLAESDLIELSLTEGDSTLRLFKAVTGSVAVQAPAASSAPVNTAPATTAALQAMADSAPKANSPAVTSGEVKASLYGVLHLTPAADEPPFVQVGDQVEAGQTLAILEAMKMFHPLKAAHGGVVEAILAVAGSEVEAGQPLFRIA